MQPFSLVLIQVLTHLYGPSDRDWLSTNGQPLMPLRVLMGPQRHITRTCILNSPALNFITSQAYGQSPIFVILYIQKHPQLHSIHKPTYSNLSQSGQYSIFLVCPDNWGRMYCISRAGEVLMETHCVPVKGKMILENILALERFSAVGWIVFSKTILQPK